MHIGNTEIFYFIIVQPTPEPEIRIQYVKINECLLKVYSSQKKWISQNYTRRVVYLYTSYFG